MRGRGTCAHCGYTLDLRADGLVATHDWPRPCRQVCPGSGKEPKVITKKPTSTDFTRAGGDCICTSCSQRYYDHPMAREAELLGYDGQPFLTRLCDGSLVKL